MSEDYDFQVVETTGQAALTHDDSTEEGRDWRQCRLLTTGMLSSIFSVAPRTVSKWFDSGRLIGFRLPNSADRRVTRAAALEFARAHRMEAIVRQLSVPFAVPEHAREAMTCSILTTGQVADILEVAPRTVSKWFDAGFFREAYRIPGSLDRRIPMSSFLTFCREQAVPLEDILGGIGGFGVLAYGKGPLLTYIVGALSHSCEIKQFSEPDELRRSLEAGLPAMMVCEVRGADTAFLETTIRNTRRASPETRVVLLGMGEGFGTIGSDLFDERFPGTMDGEIVIERIRTLLGLPI